MARATKRARQATKGATALWRAAWLPILNAVPAPSAAGRVIEVSDFGANPGGLRMFVYAPPKRLPTGAPLIVVLHGCGQNAAAFARDSGWIALAQRIGAALLLPEQASKNNRGLCFNWFQPGDVRRGSGEAASIRQMVRAAIRRYKSDQRRVFIVGLSAGAAMAAAMLAVYPATFAAGAVGRACRSAQPMVAPRRCCACAARTGSRAGRILAETVRRAAPPTRNPRAWPRLSIWQGERDRACRPA